MSTDVTTESSTEEAVRQARIDLAATLRWADRLGLSEGICNHFSLLVLDIIKPLARLSNVMDIN